MSETALSRRALIRCCPESGVVNSCAICGYPVELVKNDSANPEDWIVKCACGEVHVNPPQWCKVDSWNMRNWINRYNKNWRYLVVTAP